MKATVFTRQATVVFCMLILGSAGIISTTAAAESFDVALRQILRLSAGAAVMAAVSAVPFEKLKKLFPYGVAVSLVLLVVLLFSGTQINGMRGWFRYGSLSFQPSEPGKAFFLAGLITLLSADDSGKNPFIRKTVFPLLYLVYGLFFSFCSLIWELCLYMPQPSAPSGFLPEPVGKILLPLLLVPLSAVLYSYTPILTPSAEYPDFFILKMILSAGGGTSGSCCVQFPAADGRVSKRIMPSGAESIFLFRETIRSLRSSAKSPDLPERQ